MNYSWSELDRPKLWNVRQTIQASSSTAIQTAKERVLNDRSMFDEDQR